MIEAIIFDKDGTLIDFDAFWVDVSIKAVKQILKKFDRQDIPTEKFLAAIGVKNGISDIDGLLCKGTYEQIALAMNEVLKEFGCDISRENIIQAVIEAYNQNADSGEVKPTCENIKEVLAALKENGIKLAVVTTDNPLVTQSCLEKLGIDKMFDKIYTDDGKYPVKPDPYCAIDFSKSTGIDKEKIIMVGDTMTDVSFARNAGIGIICVGSTEQNRHRLIDYADKVIADISHIVEVIKGDKQ